METTEMTTMHFPRFGECSFAASDVIEFPWGMPGFPTLRRWLPLTVDSHANFVWLQSIDDVKVALPTADPYMIVEEYEPKLPSYAVAALDIKNPGDFTMLCVVVASDGAVDFTINLMAPIVVNLLNRRARQVMLENSGYAVRHPIARRAETKLAS